MTNSRLIAAKIVNSVISKGSYSNISLNSELSKSDLNEKDKSLVTEIVYGTLKYKYSIDVILQKLISRPLSKIDDFVINILRISLYQIIYLDKVPEFAAVNEAVQITKKYSNMGASRLVNAVLRNYLRHKDIEYADCKNEIELLAYKYSFEPWMVNMFVNQYGRDTAEKIFSGLNETPSVTVRVNNLKASYEDVWDDLKNSGYNIKEGTICPEAIEIIKGKSIEANHLFKDGMITVQDESSMLVAPSMELQQHLTVLDLCSAPGGKTAHISDIMNNTGIIRAYDLHKHKLSLLQSNFERLGVKNTICEVQDAEILNENLINSADRLLIDAPCSGMGIIRKKPEIKWSKNIEDIKKIIDIQRKILISGSQYVKNNGLLIYSTCTLNKDENENNIKWFLEKFPQFNAEKIYYGKMDNLLYNNEGTLTILPNKWMDGFFIAKLRKHE